MPSLAEAYERRASEVSRERLVLGTGLFGAGALLVVAGIVAGATPLLTSAGLGVYAAREVAGVLAGLGVPAVFLGTFAVLPASTRQRAAAVVGGSVAVLGVVLFRQVYPGGWYGPTGAPTTMTLATVLVYFAGIIVTFWFLFAAVATFKRRNDPGGTVAVEYDFGGETRTVEVAAGDADAAKQALGGVGVSGVEDRDVPTQTGPGARPTSDGGASTDDVSSPLDDDGRIVEDPPDPGEHADRYCGNCAHFEYVRTESGIQPYCGFHDAAMDDMEACPQWEANAGADRDRSDGDGVARL